VKKFTLIFGFIFLVFWLNAQTPQTFSYQAVARNLAGDLIKNQNVSFRVSILQTSSSGSAVYRETHIASTNAYGLVMLKIGGGTVESGSFASISWGTDIYFLKIEMDPAGGSSYVLMGVTQFLSVPYALFAENTAHTPKEHYASFGAEGFIPMYPGMVLTYLYGVYISSGSSSNAYLRSPVNLPDGAEILEVKFYFVDNSTTYDIEGRFRRVALSSGGATNMATVSSTGASSSVTSYVDNTISGPIISNKDNYYDLFIDLKSQTQDNYLRVIGAAIKYRLLPD